VSTALGVAFLIIQGNNLNIDKNLRPRVGFAKICVFAVILAVSMAFADNVSQNCVEEIIAISKKNGSDMQEFAKNLVPAVAKAKLQAKAPFGKPKDSDKTDIGMSFGCLKSFPESLSEIQSLLKDVGLKTLKSTATYELEDKNRKLAENAHLIVARKMEAQDFASKSSKPALKECDAIFNPSKKFCYDGKVYDLCDGMSYNPTTHICSGDIAERALCNEVQYNPLKQKCENNVLLGICGKAVYNPATHSCKDNAVIALQKCGKIVYDPVTQGCYNNTVFPKCGETLYDPKTQGCKDGVVLLKCGEFLYNPKTHYCKDGVLFAICGDSIYNPKTHGCKDNALFVLSKCGESIYNPATHGCKDNLVLPKCGETLYDPAIHNCKDNEVLARCGATEVYNTQTQECRYGSVFEKRNSPSQ